MPARVVLVRPWTDARAGGGCCGGEVRDGVTRPTLTGEPPHAVAGATCETHDPVGAAWRALRAQVPDVGVEVVDAANPWLLATVFWSARRRAGLLAALRAAAGAGTAGSVLVDGECVGDLEELAPDELVARVRQRAGVP